MMVKAGRWKNLTLTERWLILNGLAVIQERKRAIQPKSAVQLAEVKVYLDIHPGRTHANGGKQS